MCFLNYLHITYGCRIKIPSYYLHVREKLTHPAVCNRPCLFRKSNSVCEYCRIGNFNRTFYKYVGTLVILFHFSEKKSHYTVFVFILLQSIDKSICVIFYVYFTSAICFSIFLYIERKLDFLIILFIPVNDFHFKKPPYCHFSILQNTQ